MPQNKVATHPLNIYLDDIIITSETFEEHIKLLIEVLKRLKAANLTINVDKCEFFCESLKFLGYVVDQNGLRTDPDKIKAIVEYPAPNTMTQLRRFPGLCSWYRRFIRNFSETASPLYNLLKGQLRKGKIKWNKDADDAFEKIKLALTSAPVLTTPDFTKLFTLQTDASNNGGAVLTQGEGDKERVIAYASRSLRGAEKNYTVTEKECLAVVISCEKFRCYIEGALFKIITDHYSLLWLRRLQNHSGLLARWSIRLTEFRIPLIWLGKRY